MSNVPLIGIVGGLGPSPTIDLYRQTVQKYKTKSGGNCPSLLIDSVPVTSTLEERFILRDADHHTIEEMRSLLRSSVKRLASAGVQGIAMPCNTLHPLLDPIVTRFGLRFFNMVEATVASAVEMGCKVAGLLGTQSTRNELYYQSIGEVLGLTLNYPPKSDQEIVNRAILRLIESPSDERAQESVRKVYGRLARDNECVIIGCTDIKGIVDSDHVVVDSCTASEKSSRSGDFFAMNSQAATPLPVFETLC